MAVELLFEQPPTIEPQEIEGLTRRSSPSARLVDDAPRVMLSHDEFVHTYDDGVVGSIKTALVELDAATQRDKRDLAQTWDFPDAETTLSSTQAAVLLTELFGMVQPACNRMAAFSSVLVAAIESLRPTAIWAPHSQQLIRPETILDNHLAAFFNVRMHNIEGTEDSVLMDTIGLHVFRLPDWQCHYKGLDPSAVANVLYNSAAYVLDQGDVIEDGNTISGIGDNDQWRCQHEMAILPPERVVLDINTGRRHAAGERQRPSRIGKLFGGRNRS